MANKKVRMLLNLGWQDGQKINVDEKDATEGTILDLEEGRADYLVQTVRCAEYADEGLYRARTGAQEEETEESIVADLNAPDAIHKIANMRSKEKLQAIIDTDPRATVSEAAKKRLSELPA